MKNIVKLLSVCLIVFCSGQVFSQQYIAGYPAAAEGDQGSIISTVTPKGWICDYDFAEYAGASLGFLKENAYGKDGIDLTFYIYITADQNQSISPGDYLRDDLSHYEAQGVKPVVKKLDVKLDNAAQFVNYALFEFTGLPNSYKELVLITQNEFTNVLVVFAHKVGGVDYSNKAAVEKHEKEFQKNTAGFYEVAKSLSVISPVGWVIPYNPYSESDE